MAASVPREQYWAKLDDRHGWHPLIAHGADVAAVLERLLADDAPSARALAASAGADRVDPGIKALLVHLAALHDLGKTNHGFQERRHPPSDRAFAAQGHVGVALRSFVDVPEFMAGVVAAMSPLDLVTDGVELFLATIAHHGIPLDVDRPRDLGATERVRSLWMPAPELGRAPLEEINRLGQHARRWSGIDGVDVPEAAFVTPAFTHVFAGLLTVADWVGSTFEAFPFDTSAVVEPEAYWSRTQRHADRACRDIGLVPRATVRRLTGAELFPALFPTIFGRDRGVVPNQLQATVAAAPLPAPGARLLVEAATGSGKTEAALALYARLRAERRVGGLMFALPTRATARAMHDRVRDMLQHLHDGDSPPVTLAVGGDSPQQRSRSTVIDGTTLQYDEDAQGRRSVLESWASTHTKKFLAAEVVVGTIDQTLLAALAVKHAHLRLAGLNRLLLVVDEVHSHDRYMLETLRTLLDVHRSCGGIALVMSATLASRTVEVLAGRHPDEAPDFETAVGRAYPALSTLGSDGSWQATSFPDATPTVRAVWTLSDEDAALTEAVTAAAAGARVCVLRNVVADAQRTVEDISARGAGAVLWRPGSHDMTPAYHARFAAADRAYLDAAVLRAFGKDAPTQCGTILVATQVIEQSLDVDFDLLVTDLAPVEVLLQRLGRVHRHRSRDSARPAGYRAPRLVAVAPERVAPEARSQGRGLGTVYTNTPALELTRRLVAEARTIELPFQYRWLVESVYHNVPLASLRGEPGWASAVDKAEGVDMSHATASFQATLRFDQTYRRNETRYRDEARIRTRIGDDTLRVALEPSARCWYAEGERSEHVDLPERQLRGHPRRPDGSLEPLIGSLRDDGYAEYALGGGRRLTYGPLGWRVSA